MFITEQIEATTTRQCLENLPPVKIDISSYSYLQGHQFTYVYPQDTPTVIDIFLDTNTCLNLMKGEIISQKGFSQGPKTQ